MNAEDDLSPDCMVIERAWVAAVCWMPGVVGVSSWPQIVAECGA